MKKYINIIVAALSLLMIIFTQFVSPVCNNDSHSSAHMEMATMPMKCHYTSIAVLVISIILFVLTVELYIKKSYLPITIIVFGIMLFLIPGNTPLSTGICMKDTMACHSTALWIKVFSSLIVLSGLALFFVKDKDSKIV